MVTRQLVKKTIVIVLLNAIHRAHVYVYTGVHSCGYNGLSRVVCILTIMSLLT